MAESNPQDRLKEITDSIERGIQELFESEKYKQYLRTMSRFHKYSVNNTMLIFMQKPDATLVAGFNKWRDQFKRHVIRAKRASGFLRRRPIPSGKNGRSSIRIPNCPYVGRMEKS